VTGVSTASGIRNGIDWLRRRRDGIEVDSLFLGLQLHFAWDPDAAQPGLVGVSQGLVCRRADENWQRRTD
jgi:hypothetical protein